MSKQQEPAPTPAPTPTHVDVRALSDLPQFGCRAGQLASVPIDQLPALQAQGLVDDHPDAVAYCRSLSADA